MLSNCYHGSVITLILLTTKIYTILSSEIYTKQSPHEIFPFIIYVCYINRIILNSIKCIVLLYMQKSIRSRYPQHSLNRRTLLGIILQIADFSHYLGYDFGNNRFAIVSGNLFI